MTATPAPEVLEAMAKAFAEHDNAGMWGSVVRWKHEETISRMQSALSAAKAEGWVMVPVEPTEAMIVAGGLKDYWQQMECQETRAPEIYKAMLQAAQNPGDKR